MLPVEPVTVIVRLCAPPSATVGVQEKLPPESNLELVRVPPLKESTKLYVGVVKPAVVMEKETICPTETKKFCNSKN